uniref:Uncharacterized protein n=1 Tax=Pseudomonas graminis TaxID=158627 RepID=A0A7C2AX01_9PSED
MLHSFQVSEEWVEGIYPGAEWPDKNRDLERRKDTADWRYLATIGRFDADALNVAISLQRKSAD